MTTSAKPTEYCKESLNFLYLRPFRTVFNHITHSSNLVTNLIGATIRFTIKVNYLINESKLNLKLYNSEKLLSDGAQISVS